MSDKTDDRYAADDNGDRHLIGLIRPKLTKWIFWIGAVSQLIVIAVAAFIYLELRGLNSSHAFTVAMTAIVVIEVVSIAAIVELIMYPLDTIARAISSSTGEHTDAVPPNPNRAHGPLAKELGKAIDFCYANNDAKDQGGSHNSSIGGRATMAALAATSLLRSLPVGIVAIDESFNIIAFNNNTPITNTSGQPELQLDFGNNGQSLRDWFTQVSATSIETTRTWTHIQNVPSGSTEPRHVYDVVANYRQLPTHGVCLIVVTIDRTADYVDSEGDVDFVALAAHELRGPITVIRGYLDMLDEQIRGTATAEQRDLLDRLNVSARRLSSYVNNILNANRYDRRHLQLKLVRTTIADITADIRSDLDLRASTVNRHLVWDIPTNLPDIAADKSTIGEVITNLVDNAIKYSYTGGSIEISAQQSGDFVAVSVTDHGIGIAHSAADNLFSKFYRSHRSSSSVGGTGIGLYISRGIVESHGGFISVDSTEGKGSTFTFTIPLYDSVKNQLASNGNSNVGIMNGKREQIRNHDAIK